MPDQATPRNRLRRLRRPRVRETSRRDLARPRAEVTEHQVPAAPRGTAVYSSGTGSVEPYHAHRTPTYHHQYAEEARQDTETGGEGGQG